MPRLAAGMRVLKEAGESSQPSPENQAEGGFTHPVPRAPPGSSDAGRPRFIAIRRESSSSPTWHSSARCT